MDHFYFYFNPIFFIFSCIFMIYVCVCCDIAHNAIWLICIVHVHCSKPINILFYCAQFERFISSFDSNNNFVQYGGSPRGNDNIDIFLSRTTFNRHLRMNYFNICSKIRGLQLKIWKSKYQNHTILLTNFQKYKKNSKTMDYSSNVVLTRNDHNDWFNSLSVYFQSSITIYQHVSNDLYLYICIFSMLFDTDVVPIEQHIISIMKIRQK